MSTTTTPNMSLLIPVTGSESGPTYANDVNNAFTLVDSHDHSAGKGVQVTPAGLNISSDLSFVSNNATNVRSLRLISNITPVSGTNDLDCVYCSGVDLYYNDGNGNQIRITQSGALAGTPGSISGLTAPASASYSAGTFIFQSNTNTPANMDVGSLIIRNVSASSKGITISPPNSLAANYAITLPATVPAAQYFLTMDNAGAIAAPIAYANGITASNIANNTITRTQLAAVGQQVSSAATNFNYGSSSFVAVTNLTATITTSGRPVILCLQGDNSEFACLDIIGTQAGGINGVVGLFRGSTLVSAQEIAFAITGATGMQFLFPISLFVLDAVAASTYTYTIQFKRPTGTAQFNFVGLELIAYEL